MLADSPEIESRCVDALEMNMFVIRVLIDNSTADSVEQSHPLSAELLREAREIVAPFKESFFSEKTQAVMSSVLPKALEMWRQSNHALE